jgi:hypothetical protein
MSARVLPRYSFVALSVLACLCVAVGVLVCWGASAFAVGLPDGRVFEMVTPPENHDANVYTPLAIQEALLNPGEADTWSRLPFQVSVSGEAVAYVGDDTTGGEGASGAGLGNEYLATRSAGGGWTQVNLQPLGVNPVTGVNDVTGVKEARYQAFSSDLSVGVLESGSASITEPVLSAAAPSHYKLLYTHVVGEAGARPVFTTTPPGRSPAEFGTPHIPAFYSGVIAYAGASADFGQLLFEANDALTSNAVDGGSGENNLYVAGGGRLSLVNVLPDGKSEANATFGASALREEGGNPPDFSHVISGDGSRIFWTDLSTGELFVREHATEPQSPLGANGECMVSVDACTVLVSAGGRFWTASGDGSRVFFTDGGLYEDDLESGVTTELSEGASVEGVVGASEDGSYVYFVAKGALAAGASEQQCREETPKEQGGEEPKQGNLGCNLYLSHEGEKPKFIATLSYYDDTETIADLDAQVSPSSEIGDLQPALGHRTAEVTPDGRNLVFMSENSLTGYPNEVEGKNEYGTSGRKKVSEVYVYNATDGHLDCVSCNPSGEAPQFTGLSSANLTSPVRPGVGAFLPPSWSNTYQPQWISEDGSRVFFDSTEPLVSGDTNGKPDVYEWERDGSGGCQGSQGCVYLLSGGTSQSASWLLGASASGDDVFVISRAQLTPEDHDETYNVFDVRVGGVQPVSPPACTGTGCQGIPATPPVFATPPSVTFSGVGNFPPPVETRTVAKPKPKAKAKPCRKGYVKKRSRCVKRPKARRLARGRK